MNIPGQKIEKKRFKMLYNIHILITDMYRCNLQNNINNNNNTTTTTTNNNNNM